MKRILKILVVLLLVGFCSCTPNRVAVRSYRNLSYSPTDVHYNIDVERNSKHQLSYVPKYHRNKEFKRQWNNFNRNLKNNKKDMMN